MKTKTEARRQAILDIAEGVFSELGFERASMDEVSQRGGGSKATIYNYFANKEELFFAVVFRSTEAEFEATHAALDLVEQDIARALEQFGCRFLALLYSPKVQAMRRLVVAEGGRSDLGRRVYELAPARSLAMMSGFLGRAMDRGQLRRADPLLASQQLKALLDAELVERFLFHTLDSVGEAEIAAIVGRAVEVFMLAYRPREAG